MILSVELLVALFVVEFALRLALEIRERRATMLRGGIFSVLRLIPLVNDIVPLPESRKEVPESEFVCKHEEGHRHHRHSVLRNIYKVAMLLVSVWVLAAMLVRGGLPLWQAILWMHLVAIPFRALFHLYCWNQEYEADRYACGILVAFELRGLRFEFFGEVAFADDADFERMRVLDQR